MMPLRLTVLGSGSVVPSSGRRSTSLLVDAGEETVLLDCGPDAPHALEECGRSFREAERILLSHFHPDHTLGLARLFSAAANDRGSRGRRVFSICGPEGLEDFIRSWDGVYGGIVPTGDALRAREMSPGESGAFGGLTFTAGPAFHGGRPALSWRVEHGGTALAYTGDTGPSEELAAFFSGADLLAAECSFPDRCPEEGHLTPRTAGELARSAGVGTLVLVHLYPWFEDDPRIEAAKEFEGDVTVAFDGMVIEADGG